MTNKKEIKYLVLWLAGECNLKCKYCYAFPNFTHKKMSFQIARKAIESCKTKDFTLILAGGEPLLNFSLIEEIYDFLKRENYNCKIGLQTNGTLITEKIAERLSKMNINVGVSFDASFQINDEFRGETKAVIEGLKNLKLKNKRVNLNCVITDKSIKELEKMVEIAYYFENIDGIGLDLVRMGERVQNYKEIKPPTNGDIYIYLKRAYMKSKELGKIVGKEVKIREIEEIKYRKEKNCIATHYCYSSLGQAMIITEEGNIYPCSSLVGDNRYFIGNILEDREFEMQSLPSGKKEKCESCQYKDICKGCCPSRLIINEGEMEDKDCMLRKAIFKILEEEENE